MNPDRGTMVSRIATCLGFMLLINGRDFLGGTVMAVAENGEKNLSTVQYRLSFRKAETHRVDIEVSVPTDGKSEIEFMMPVWTPGSYLVREYARQVEQLIAADGKTNALLSIKKKDKNHWLVDCAGVEEVAVSPRSPSGRRSRAAAFASRSPRAAGRDVRCVRR